MKTKIIALTMLAVFLAFGCGRARSYEESYGMSMMRSAPDAAFSQAMHLEESIVFETDTLQLNDSGSSTSSNLTIDERKLIKRAFVRIRVDNLEAADTSISNLLRIYDAYSASTEADEHSRHYSLRVPAHRYEAFLSELEGMGRLIRRSESTEDVMLHYYDLEGRLEMKRGLLSTFQSYLTRARNIEEILSVEYRIAELQNEIDRTGSQLRHLSNRIDYATIDLNLLGPAAASQTQSLTLLERIAQMFSNFGKFLATVLIVIIGIILFGTPIILLLVLLYLILFGKIGLLRKLWSLVRVKK